MTAQDARERAWQEFNGGDSKNVLYRQEFDAIWDAAKREDEQRIAALVAALREADDNIACECVLEGMADGRTEWTICGPHAVIRRALAGIEERSSAG